MSHFAVLVILPPGTPMSQGYLSRVLDPYDENKEVEPYLDGTSAEEVAEQMEEIKQKCIAGDAADYIKEYRGTIDTMSIQQFAKSWYEQEADENGNLYTTYNPNSKWDWYQVGGRWPGMLQLKSGNCVDIAQLKDVDFDGWKQSKIQQAEKDWAEAEGKEPQERYWQYGIKREDTKESFIKHVSSFSTFAVITPDGEWYQKGKMGWWAVVSDEEAEWGDKFHERFLENCDPESVLVIVDCHI